MSISSYARYMIFPHESSATGLTRLAPQGCKPSRWSTACFRDTRLTSVVHGNIIDEGGASAHTHEGVAVQQYSPCARATLVVRASSLEIMRRETCSLLTNMPSVLSQYRFKDMSSRSKGPTEGRRRMGCHCSAF